MNAVSPISQIQKDNVAALAPFGALITAVFPKMRIPHFWIAGFVQLALCQNVDRPALETRDTPPDPALSRTVYNRFVLDYLNPRAINIDTDEPLVPIRPMTVIGPSTKEGAAVVEMVFAPPDPEDGKTASDTSDSIDPATYLIPIVRTTVWDLKEPFEAPTNQIIFSKDGTGPTVQEAGAAIGETTLTNEDIMNLAVETFNQNPVFDSWTNNQFNFTANMAAAMKLSPVSSNSSKSKRDLNIPTAELLKPFQFGNIPMSQAEILDKGKQMAINYARQTAKNAAAQFMTFAFGDTIPKLLDFGMFPFAKFKKEDVVPTIEKVTHLFHTIHKEWNGGFKTWRTNAKKVLTFGSTVYDMSRTSMMKQAGYARFESAASFSSVCKRDDMFSSLEKRFTCVPPGGVTSKILSDLAFSKDPKDAGSLRQIQQRKSVGAPINRIEKVSSTNLKTIISKLGIRVDPISWIIAPVFIALDFAKGHYGAAIVSMVGFAISTAVAYIGGPIGWIAAIITTIITAIISMLFKEDVRGHTNDPISIIQWTLFGDKKINGAESCNSERKKHKEPENCEVSLGPGYLAQFFQMELFDAVALLLVMNDGQMVTTTELAKELHILDKTVPGDGADKMFTVYCQHNNKCPPPGEKRQRLGSPRGGMGNKKYDSECSPSKQNNVACDEPIYSFNRSAAQIPVLGQPASQVYDRVKDGDCKILIDPPEGIIMPTFNMNYTGRPAAFVCGLPDTYRNYVTNQIPPKWVSGQQVYGDTPDFSSYKTPANQSTDGSVDRGFDAPPNGTIPLKLLSSENAACLSGGTGMQCFPKGTYQAQDGTFGFYQKGANTLSMPLGSAMNILPPASQPDSSFGTSSFIQNMTANNNFADMNTFIDTLRNNNADKDGFFEIDVPDPITVPNACFFTRKEFKGDVFCFGPGSATLPSGFQNRALSVVPGGGAKVWIYADYLGSKEGVSLQTSYDDLNMVPFGNGGNFAQNIKAVWIAAS
ncbi:MAG: hypothetical protein M1825_000880 [Sarcosagium campestre]|nr:MAG: hypothetical protein M1825_000880 [Sarcosagium campestre]